MHCTNIRHIMLHCNILSIFQGKPMNIFEKQAELGRTIFEINTNAMRSTAELQQQNFRKYLETMQSFGGRLPEIQDVSSFVELQREYGEAVVANATEAVEEQTSIVRDSFEQARGALEQAFQTDQATA